MPFKIHFINRIDFGNVGDWNCSPLNYFFDFFRDYNLMRHDIDFIDWFEIDRRDVVILGGGGMLNVTASFNRHFNKLLDRCDHVLAWGVGFNTHDKQWYQGKDFEEIDCGRFKAIGIRDYNHPSGLEWLPCCTALAPEMLKRGIARRKIGIIEHQSLPIVGLPYEKISNAFNFEDVINFIAESEVIVTNSYHMTYWSQLMAKKSIVVDSFSTKFNFFKYKPISLQSNAGIFDTTAIERAVDEAVVHDSFLGEARDLNEDFFERVKDIVLKCSGATGNGYQNIYALSRLRSWNENDKHGRLERLVDDVSQRMIDLDARISNDFSSLSIGVHGRLDWEATQLHNRIDEREGFLLSQIGSRPDVTAILVEDARNSAEHDLPMSVEVEAIKSELKSFVEERAISQRSSQEGYLLIARNIHARIDSECKLIHDRISERESLLRTDIEVLIKTLHAQHETILALRKSGVFRTWLSKAKAIFGLNR